MATAEVSAWYQEKAEEDPKYTLYTPHDLLKLAIKLGRPIKRIGERVPVFDIITEDSVIDKAHAKELADSIVYSGKGQTTGMSYRGRFEAGRVVYDVIDGYHRSYGQRIAFETLQAKFLDPNAELSPAELDFLKKGHQTYGTVFYNLSDQSLYGQRILAANSVKAIQFPRIVEWIQKLYALSPWANTGLTVVQALGITFADSKRSYNTNLSAEEIQELKKWVSESCTVWNRPVSSIYQILRLAADSDPELVKQVRVSGGGKDREGRITPDRLKAVVTKFPGEEYYAAQRSILKIVVEKRLYKEETVALVERIADLIVPQMSEDAIYQIANKIRVGQSLKNLAAFNRQTKTEPAAAEENFGDDDSVRWEDLEPSDEEIMALEQTGDFVCEPDEIPLQLSAPTSSIVQTKGKKPTTPSLVERTKTYGEGNTGSIVDLRQRNRDLTTALKIIQEQLENGKPKGVLWWQTSPNLSPMERFFFGQLVSGIQDFDQLCRGQGVPFNRALSYIFSASKRRWLELNQEVETTITGKENITEEVLADPEVE